MSLLEHYKQFIGPRVLKRQTRTQNDEGETVWGTTVDETFYGAVLPIGRSIQQRIRDDINLVKVTMIMRTEQDLEACIDDIVVDGSKNYKVKGYKLEHDPDTGFLDHYLYYLAGYE